MLSTVPAPPFQESEVISNKTDKDGHHYLKVLLLSNKKTRNNWIAPYKRIGDLPKEVIESFIGLPHINEHSYPYFIQLKDKLERQGKSDDEIVKTLKEESQKLGLDYIDHVFMDDPNSSLLYGQLKVMDKKENEFIEKNGRPSKNFTSPGVFGTAKILQDGTEEYDMNTLRAFHLASVDIPAFPEQEAAVKGVCSNGNSESCRKVLAVAGFDSTQYPQPLSTDEPTENVNNTCNCNKNIDMSSNNPQITADTITHPVTSPQQPAVIEPTKLIEGAKNTTAEAIQAAREEANKVVQENENKKIAAEKEKEEEKNKPQLTEAEVKLKQTTKQLEEERNEKLEMKNFFLEKMLVAAIPEENFKEKKDFIELKDSTKGLINKYGMSLEDADWLISKVSKSIPVIETVSTETKKETNKKSVGVAGWTGMGNIMYNSDYITRPEKRNVSSVKPQSGSNTNGIEDEDYIQFLPS